MAAESGSGWSPDPIDHEREHSLCLRVAVGRVFRRKADRVDQPEQVVDVDIAAHCARLLCARQQAGADGP
jgi:hypothetical protein